MNKSDCEVFGVKTAPSSGPFEYSSGMSPATQQWRFSLSPPKVLVCQRVFRYSGASLVAQMVRNPPATKETGAVKAHCGYLFGNSTCYLDIGMVHAYPMESPWAYLLSPVASEPIWPQTGCCSASRHSVAPPHRLPALLLLNSLKSTLFEAPLRSCLILCW